MRHHLRYPIVIALIGGFILALWGAVSWRVLADTVKQFPHEKVVLAAIEATAPESGLYLAPYYPADRAPGQPLFFGVVHPAWCEMNGPSAHLCNFLAQSIAAYIALWLLRNKSSRYWRQVADFTLLGFFAAWVIYAPNCIFLQYPVHFTFISIVDVTIGWFLAGLAIVKLTCKPIS